MTDDAPGDTYEELPDLGLDFDLDDTELEITSADGAEESFELEESASASEEIAEITAEIEDFELEEPEQEDASAIESLGESLEIEEPEVEVIADVEAEPDALVIEEAEIEEGDIDGVPGSLELEEPEVEDIPDIAVDSNSLNLDESVQEEAAVADPEEIVESIEEVVAATESDAPVQEANHEDAEPAISPEGVDEATSSKGDSWFKKVWKSLFS